MRDFKSPKHVKVVRSHGRTYTYFIMGRTEIGSPILAALPAIGSPEFEAAYNQCLAMRAPTTRSNVAARIERGRESAARRAAQQSKTEFVYFIVAQSGSIKIGRSVTPLARLRRLQTGHHEHLSLVAVTQGGPDLERKFHERFAAHRVSGEWFTPHPEIWDEIGHIVAFDRPTEAKNKAGQRNGIGKGPVSH